MAPPVAPSALTATATSAYYAIDLAWTNNDTYDTITIYRKYTGGSYGGAGAPVVISGLDDHYTDYNCLEGISYTYKVVGYSLTLGYSSDSNEDEATTLLRPPSGLTADDNVGENRIDLEWTNGSPDYTSIEIYRGGVLLTTLTSVGPPTQHIDTSSIVVGTTYSYQVRGMRGTVASALCTAATGTTGLNTPGTLYVITKTGTTIDLGWVDNSNNETGYVIYNAASGAVIATVATPNLEYYQRTGLVAGNWYSFYVKAYVGAILSAASNTIVVYTVSPPTAPDSVVATPTGVSTMTVTWADKSSNEDGFRIQRSLDDITYVTVGTVGANVTTFLDTGLATYTLYYYKVCAISASLGDSAYSAAGSGTTTDFVAAPTNLVASCAADGVTITLTWQDNSNNETGFDIYKDGVSHAPNAAADAVTINDTVVTATGYLYKVRAFNATPTVSLFSNEVYIYAGAATATPVPVADLAAQAKSAGEIQLTWTLSATAVGYKIERSTTSATSGFTQIADVLDPIAAYADVSCSALTQYWYRLRAYNAGGNSAYCTAVTATTTSGPAQTHILDLVDIVEIVSHQPEKGYDEIANSTVYRMGTYTNIPRDCFWRFKDTDFAEELGQEVADLEKRVNYIKLIYVDMAASTPTVIKVSVDGGLTWETQKATLGTGDGMTKEYTFDFSPVQNVCGNILTFEIACYDASKDFRWVAIEVDLTIFGSRTTASS